MEEATTREPCVAGQIARARTRRIANQEASLLEQQIKEPQSLPPPPLILILVALLVTYFQFYAFAACSADLFIFRMSN